MGEREGGKQKEREREGKREGEGAREIEVPLSQFNMGWFTGTGVSQLLANNQLGDVNMVTL